MLPYHETSSEVFNTHAELWLLAAVINCAHLFGDPSSCHADHFAVPQAASPGFSHHMH
jgi:hypothetical protein